MDSTLTIYNEVGDDLHPSRTLSAHAKLEKLNPCYFFDVLCCFIISSSKTLYMSLESFVAHSSRHVNMDPLPPGGFRETIISRGEGGIKAEVTREGDRLPGETISLEDCEQEAIEKSQSIFSSFARLNIILKRYENLIRTRWAKKTRGQRKEILVAGWKPKIMPLFSLPGSTGLSPSRT